MGGEEGPRGTIPTFPPLGQGGFYRGGIVRPQLSTHTSKRAKREITKDGEANSVRVVAAKVVEEEGTGGDHSVKGL